MKAALFYISTILDSERFCTAKMTFKVIQGHRKLRGSIEDIRFWDSRPM